MNFFCILVNFLRVADQTRCQYCSSCSFFLLPPWCWTVLIPAVLTVGMALRLDFDLRNMEAAREDILSNPFKSFIFLKIFLPLEAKT